MILLQRLCPAFALMLLAATQAIAVEASPEIRQLIVLGQYDKLATETQFVPTSDGKSFWAVHKGSERPHHWIVSLGSNEFASQAVQFWSDTLKGRDAGLIVLQWPVKGKKAGMFNPYTPREIYREIELMLPKVTTQGDRMMLYGFNKGAANVYAVKALDFVNDKNYFPYILVNAGGASLDYSPTDSVNTGVFGAQPFEGTLWITGCGLKNPEPEKDGCPAMERTARWIESKGGKVAMQLQGENSERGAFQNNSDNMAKVLNWFLLSKESQ